MIRFKDVWGRSAAVSRLYILHVSELDRKDVDKIGLPEKTDVSKGLWMVSVQGSTFFVNKQNALKIIRQCERDLPGEEWKKK